MIKFKIHLISILVVFLPLAMMYYLFFVAPKIIGDLFALIFCVILPLFSLYYFVYRFVAYDLLEKKTNNHRKNK